MDVELISPTKMVWHQLLLFCLKQGVVCWRLRYAWRWLAYLDYKLSRLARRWEVYNLSANGEVENPFSSSVYIACSNLASLMGSALTLAARSIFLNYFSVLNTEPISTRYYFSSPYLAADIFQATVADFRYAQVRLYLQVLGSAP